MRDLLFVAIIVGGVASTLVTLLLFFGDTGEKVFYGFFAGTPLTLTIADSEEARHQGLSGRQTIGEQEGLFFVFEKPGVYGVWMKDMHFSIDTFWFDENLKLIHIESAIPPSSYPEVFYPPSPALYILETREGFADEFHISLGDTISVFPHTPRLFKNKPFFAF
jgi:uncharacterized membrane protein (UPF0127 family)